MGGPAAPQADPDRHRPRPRRTARRHSAAAARAGSICLSCTWCPRQTESSRCFSTLRTRRTCHRWWSRENILAANSKLAISDSIAEVTGPSAGGVLVQILTAPIAIAFDAVHLSLVSAFSLALIRKPEAPPERAADRKHMLREIADGLDFCWHNIYLRPMILRMATGAFSRGSS